MRTKLDLQDSRSFAYVKERFIKEQHLTGTLLVICGHEYKAWNYDTYIWEAIAIASRWEDDQRTYTRIHHLRNWLRENIQHDHQIPTQVRTIAGAAKLCEKIIRAEYEPVQHLESFKGELEFQLKVNAEVFSQAHTKAGEAAAAAQALEAANKAELHKLGAAMTIIKKHFPS